MSDRRKKMSGLSITAIFMVNFAYMSDMVLIPVADDVFTSFERAPSWILNFILTGSQLVAAVSALLAPALMRRFEKRRIILAFFSLFTISSCLGAAINNVYYIALMRALTGFSFGALAPTAMALITDIYWEDARKCSDVIGAFNGVMAAVGSLMSILAGLLCRYGWRFAFLEYLAAVPMLIFMFLFLPRGSYESAAVKSPETQLSRVPIRGILLLVASVMLSCLTFNTMTYQCSIFISETGYGGAAFAGVISCILALCASASSFVFGFFYRKLRSGVCVLGFGLTAFVYLGCCLKLGRAWLIFCMVVLGLAYGLELPFFYMQASVIASADKRPLIMGIVAASLGFGAFITSYAITLLRCLLHAQTLIQLWPIYAALALLGAALSLAQLAVERKKRYFYK